MTKQQKLYHAQEMNKLIRDAIAEEVIPNKKRLIIDLKRRPIEWVREYLRERMVLMMKPSELVSVVPEELPLP